MIEKDLNKVLNYMKQYVENKYEHDSEPMLNWKDLKLILDEIERLNNIINELEKWLENEIKRIEELQNSVKSKVKPYGEEYNNYTLIIGAYDNVLDKLQELKGSESNE